MVTPIQVSSTRIFSTTMLMKYSLRQQMFIFLNFFSLIFFQRTTKTADTMAMKPPTIFFLLLSAVQVFGQSNYASHGNNINYIGNGLPEETVLDGKVSDIDFSERE